MRDSDDLPYIVIERHSGSLGAFVWGALLGAGAALLLAPRSGAETQEDIRQGVRRVRSAAEDRVDAARDTVSRTRTRIEDQIGTVKQQLSTVREQLDSKAERARDSFESGRRAARDARAELERRVSDVRESYGSMLGDRGGAGTPRSPDSGLDSVITDTTDTQSEGRPDLG